MALAPGTQLGPYEVLALLGAGGMGEVYRARDPRLGREVAIKVLPHDRVADESRRQRFVQEAKAASALNHPHIVTIHEIESANGIDFLVMEYVRGKSLDALIPRQGMRLGEALRIAIAVADAVACAHKHNIVHRDLKPANVMVGTDGAVKVLDFGLAKLLTDDGDSDPHSQTRTADEAITKRGAVMGTLAYMSPEQATGEPVDARSDVFSFGAMLYEMVTGVGPFSGKTPTDTLANVLRAQPKPPTQVAPALPHELERLILRCLRREPARRFQHMADVKVDLQEIKEESDSGRLPAPIPARAQLRRGRLIAAVVVAAVAIVTALVATIVIVRPDGPPPRLVPLTALTGLEWQPSLSPDGEQVAFVWDGEKQDNDDNYHKLVGSSESRRLTSDAG
jgi:serine/threonine protein kinase